MANISHFTQTVNGVSTTYDIHDANAVDLTSNQTVGGIKTFSNAPVVGSINLDGKTIDTDANGNMVYDGHIVDTIEEQGEDYIRYSNGVQICWGVSNDIQCNIHNNAHFTISYKVFDSNPSLLLTRLGGATGWAQLQCSVINPTTTYTTVDVYNTGGENVSSQSKFFWQAIGRWK